MDKSNESTFQVSTPITQNRAPLEGSERPEAERQRNGRQREDARAKLELRRDSAEALAACPCFSQYLQYLPGSR